MNIVEALMPLAVDIDQVTPDPNNARVGHALTGLAESLEKYGQRKPIVVNKATGHIEAGNGTWRAAKSLDWKKIAVVYVEDDDEAAAGYGIADNRLNDLSTFDNEVLDRLLDEIEGDVPGIERQVAESFGVMQKAFEEGKGGPVMVAPAAQVKVQKVPLTFILTPEEKELWDKGKGKLSDKKYLMRLIND